MAEQRPRAALAAAEAQPSMRGRTGALSDDDWPVSLAGVGTDRPRDTSATHCAVPLLLDGAAEAQPAPAPVAWMCPDDPDRATAFYWPGSEMTCHSCTLDLVPLYAAPVAAAQPESPQPVAVPQGYALVPVEPTPEMWAAVNKLDDEMAAGAYDGRGCTIEQAWDCLLAAAPAAPAPQPLKRLTDKQVSKVYQQWYGTVGTSYADLIHAAVAEFCRVNGIKGAA